MSRRIIISTDSVCDLPAELTDKYHIYVNPYYVVTDGGRFRDNIEIGCEDLVSYMKSGLYARSQSPSVEEYQLFFHTIVEKDADIIHITMGKNSSKGYFNATEAAAEFENVTVYDSGHLSSAMGLVAIRAAELAAAGYDKDYILSRLTSYTKKVSCQFLVNDLEYMYRAGRISKLVRNMSYRLMFRPVLYLKDSSICVRRILFGRWKQVVRQQVSCALKRPEKIDTRYVFITHVNLDPETLELIKTEVLKNVQFQSVIFINATAAISANCGSGTVGILFARIQEEEYMSKENPMEALYHIDYLDVRNGMLYVADNVDLYLDVLKEYVHDNKQIALDEYLAHENYKDYRILVHALKSSSKTIGLNHLSERARLLEFACKDESYDYIRNNHASVMDEYRRMREQIMKAINE